jgi:hypothetical protein
MKEARNTTGMWPYLALLAGVGLASRRSHPSEEANTSRREAGEHE